MDIPFRKPVLPQLSSSPAFRPSMRNMGVEALLMRSSCVLVPHVGDGQILPVSLVTQLCFLVPQVPVPVGVEVQQQPAGS